MSFLRTIAAAPLRLLTSTRSPAQEAETLARRASGQLQRDLLPDELKTAQGRALTRLFRMSVPSLFGGKGEEEPTETRVSAGLAEAPPDLLAQAREQAQAPAQPRRRRRGPATLFERSQRLEHAVRIIANDGHVEYRANTIAVIKDPGIITKIMRLVAWVMLIVPRLIARAVAWVLRPRGRGRLKRRVVFVDRRGNIVVFRA